MHFLHHKALSIKYKAKKTCKCFKKIIAFARF